MTSPSTGSNHVIHIDMSRVEYALSDDDLTRITEAAKNDWKEFFLVSFPAGATCIINAIADTRQPFVLSLGLFLNYLFGLLGIFGAVVFGIMWYRTKRNLGEVISKIKDRPRMSVVQAGDTLITQGGEIETVRISG